MKRAWSIKAYLVLLAVAVALPFTTLLARLIHTQTRDARLQANASAAGLAEVLAAKVSQYLADAEATLSRVSRRPAVQAMDPARPDRSLSEFVELQPDVVNLMLVDPRGRLVWSAVPARPRAVADLGGLQWFQDAVREQRLVGGGPLVDPVTGKPASVLAYPVLDEKGALKGVLGLAVNLARLAIPSVERLPLDSMILIVDAGGTIIARTGADQKYVGMRGRGKEVVDQTLAAGPREFVARGVDGVARLYAAREISQAGWHAIAGIPTQFAYAPLRKQVVQSVAFSLLIITMVAGLALRLSWSISEPVSALARAVDRAAQGEWDAGISTGGPAEVARAAAGLKAMLHSRRQAEQAIRSAEARWRAIIEAEPQCVMTVAPDGGVREINRAGLRMLEARSADEVRAIRLGDLAAEDCRQQLARLVEDAVQGRQAEAELTCVGLRGTRHVLAIYAVRLETGGEDSSILVVARDVTEQKRVEQEKDAMTQRISNILESTTDAFVHMNANWEYTYVNARAEQLLQKRREEMIGINCWQVFPQSVGSDFYHRYLRCMEKQQAGHFDVYFPTLDMWYEVHAYPSAEGLAIYFHDITERKRVQEQIQKLNEELQQRVRDQARNEARFRRLVESNLLGIILADFSGRITYANAAFLNMLGYTEEDVAEGRVRWDTMTPAEHADADRRVIEEIMTRGTCPPWEKEYLHRDGRRVPVLVGVALLEEGQGDCIAFVLDLTERKQQEEIRRKNVELEEQNRRIQEANRLKSEFLAHMSHELRTPLNAVIGFSEFLLDGKPGPLNNNQREYLQDVLSGGKHLLQLINDVLDLAKIEAGKMELNPERFLVDKAVAEVCSILKPLTQQKSVTIRCEADRAIGIVTVDQQKFKQVLYNLLSNAVKFSPDGGVVHLLIKPFGSGMFEMSVKDKGPGIRREDIPRLFREFQQLDAGAARKHEGTGLGLALTKKIVEFQRGTIGVESEYGNGSTFTVMLPIETPLEAFRDGRNQGRKT